MSEERRGRGMMDPTELWRQWYETSVRMWSDAAGAGRNNYLDPFGIYRQWFNGLEDFQQQMFGAMNWPAMTSLMATNNGSLTAASGDQASAGNPATEPAAQNPAAALKPVSDVAAGRAVEVQNLWNQWFEATQESWQKSLAVGQEAVELTPRWISTLDQIRNNLLSAGGYPTDPLQLSTRLYNATSGPLSDFVGDLIEREDILDVSSQFLQSYASFYKVFRRNSEEYLKNLSIPVRSDITRVAELVLALEDKIDRIEEAFEDFEDGQAALAQDASAQDGGNIEGRIEGIEQRLGNVEGKIDQILAALESTPRNGSVQAEAPRQPEASQEDGSEIRATAAARRKAQELDVDLSDVNGTGSDGQITVDDVRRKGAS